MRQWYRWKLQAVALIRQRYDQGLSLYCRGIKRTRYDLMLLKAFGHNKQFVNGIEHERRFRNVIHQPQRSYPRRV